MSTVAVYHPELDTTIDVPESALPHMRRSGWVLRSEHDDRAASDAAQAADKKTARTPAKAADEAPKQKTDEEK